VNLAALQSAGEWLLDCACAALAESPCGCPDWAAVVTGVASWDSCCGSGQLYVVATSVYPSANFPIQEDPSARCRTGLVGLFTVGIIRCAPTFDDQGNPPSCSVQAEAAAAAMADAMAVVQGLGCCMYEVRNQFRAGVTGQRFVGPAGGCMGSETTAAVELTDSVPIVGS